MSRAKKQTARTKSWTQRDTRSLVAAAKHEYDDGPPMQMLQRLVADAENPGGDLAALAAYDDDPFVMKQSMAVLFMAVKEAGVPQHIQQQLRDQARPALLQAMHNPDVPDERKFMLGPMYMLCGGELSEEDYRNCFDDFEAVAQQQIEQVGDYVSDQPSSVHEALSAMEILDDDADERFETLLDPLVSSCLALCLRNPEAAAAALCATAAIACEHPVESESLASAMQTVADHPSPRVAWHLGEFGRWPACGEPARQAAVLASQMQAAGVGPQCTLFREFSHGLVSMVDGVGSRSVSLFFRTPEGGMDALILILNDTVGMKDAWCSFDDSADIEQSIRDSRDDVLYAPCTLDFARKLVADAWALHEQQDRPFPGRFFIYRLYLGEQPIGPRRHTPNLGAYMMETMVSSPALVDGSEILCDQAPHDGLWFSSDEAYEFLNTHRSRRGWRLPKGKLDEYIRAIAPLERDQLLSRMAGNLEAEAIAGRATQKINQIAARTWLGIEQQVQPLHDVPYIRALAKKSVSMIMQNLRSGYTRQQQANDATMEMDQDMAALFDEMTDGWDHPVR